MRKIAFWLSLVVIFTIPWENMILIESLGTIGRATGLLVAVFWVATVMVTGEFRKPHPFHIAFFLFLLWNAMSAFWSIDIDRTVDRLITYLQLFILVYILWDLYTSNAFLVTGLQAYVLGAYVSIASTVAIFLASGNSGPDRFAAQGFNENDLGLILALGIPVAWYLATSQDYGKTVPLLRVVNYAYVPAAILAILLTGSRGSLTAALPALLFILVSLTKLKIYQRILLFAATIAVIFQLQPLIPQSSIQRVRTISSALAEGDLTGRVEIWNQGLDSLAEHFLAGIGSGAFRTAVESGKVAHNVFLSVLVEVGTIGFILFTFILIIVIFQAMQQPKWKARLWLTVLLVWTLGASVHTWEHRKPTWLFLSLVVVSAGLHNQQEESTHRFLQQTVQSTTSVKNEKLS